MRNYNILRKIIKGLFIISLIAFCQTKIYSQDIFVNFYPGSDTVEISSIKVENLSNGTVYNLTSIDALHIIEASDVRFMSQSFNKCEIYPNPADGTFYINFVAEKSEDVVISLIDAGGRLVFSESFYAERGYHKTEITGGLKGLYFVSIKGESFFYSEKISGTASNQQRLDLNNIQYIPLSESQITYSTKEIAQYDMPYTYGDVLIFTFLSNEGNKTYRPLVINNAEQYAAGDVITIPVNFYACQDKELREYGVVEIDDMVWMAENLNTTSFANNSSIKNITSDNTWQQLTTVAYCDYENKTDNSDIYGKLYNWYAVDHTYGICPQGWHVPSDAEWIKLERWLGMGSSSIGVKGWRGTNEGCYLKTPGTEFWSADPDEQTNAAAFFALPGGIRTLTGEFRHLGDYASWWTATSADEQNAWCRALRADSCDIYREDGSKTLGLSVRCVYNEISDTVTPTFTIPTVTTLMIDSILMESAYFSGEILSDGGAAIYEMGFVWDTISGPSVGVSSQYICNTADAIAFSGVITGLISDKTYYVRAYANNVAGIAYGEEINFTTLRRYFTGGTGVTDVDGNLYPTVIINGREYMAENLRTANYNDGTVIAKITDGAVWSALVSGAYCWTEDDSASYDVLYGKLYNFEAVNSGKLCPTGWHVPSDIEWKELEIALDMDAAAADELGWRGTNQGGMLKETGFANWLAPNSGATNQSGMNIKPSGYRATDGNYQDVGSTCYYWTQSINATSSNGFCRMISSSETGVYRGEEIRTKGSSVRCMKDYAVVTTTITTLPAAEITTSSAIIRADLVDVSTATVIEKGFIFASFEDPDLSNNEGIFISEANLGVYQDTATGLNHATTYYYKSFVTTENGTSYGLQVTFTTLTELFTAGTGMTDFDGNSYNTILIGSTEYTTSNLRTSRYNDGTPLLRANNSTNWTANMLPMYCWYNDDSTANELRNGKLYNFYAVSGGNLCPAGWHVASDSEWKQLEHALGMSSTDTSNTGWRGTDQGAKLKEYGNVNWLAPNTGATNQSGYTATGSGYRNNDGTFAGLNEDFCIWTTSPDISAHSWVRKLKNSETGIYRGLEADENGFSVRCVKTPITTPEVVTGSTTDISISTAIIHGNITHDSWVDITAKGIVWNSTGNPDLDNNEGFTNEGEGIGEIVSIIYNLEPDTEYHVKTYATNEAGTAYGEEISFTTLSPIFIEGPGTSDAEGNTYRTVIINGQEWMAENLKSTAFQMAKTENEEDSENQSFAKDTVFNGSLYGRTYAAFELMQMGRCPSGWEFATEENWQQLEVYLGMTPEDANSMGWRGTTEGGKIKEPGFQTWNSPNTGATNETGLNIKAGGFFDEFSEFSGEGTTVRFWTSGNDTLEPYFFYARELSYDHAGINRIVSPPESNYYVRCVKPQGLPIVYTKPLIVNEYFEHYSGGIIYSDGGEPITNKGVLWSHSPGPDLSNAYGFTDEGSGSDEYVSEMYEINPGETYYMRAYATNMYGTAYGNTIQFTGSASVQQMLDYGIRPLAIYNMGYPLDSLYGRIFDEGIIISLDIEDGGGLLCSMSDIGEAEWGCMGFPTGATAVSYGTGKYNTAQIMENCLTSMIAASECRYYNSGWFTDWYLPSQDEMLMIFARSEYITNLSTDSYWTSSESITNPENLAIGVQQGSIIESDKSYIYWLRPVRHFECEPVFDTESNYYPVVRIGTQSWMGENLKTMYFSNGDPIDYAANSTDWTLNSASPVVTFPQDDFWTGQTYGNLYNYNAVFDPRNICPIGWRVPTDADWDILVNFLGGEPIAGGKLKNEGTGVWMSPNEGATNLSGFNALPTGLRNDSDGNFEYFGERAYFWSSTAQSALSTWSRSLYYNNTMVTRSTSNNTVGYNVRCIK
jgi:uncharacterized protein (TIGR02145 family)